MVEPRVWLQEPRLLTAPDQPYVSTDVLIAADGQLLAMGEHAVSQARAAALQPRHCPELWLAPALVDPHSVLEDPLSGRAETLASLSAAALAGGYGSLALLPWGNPWRDRPERLLLPDATPLQLLLWGSFTRNGEDLELAPHADQLAAGALGLAGADHCPPLALLERGLRLAETGEAPLLLAPRDPSIAGPGFVREGADALRAGWPLDTSLSETVPLQALLTLAIEHRAPALRLLNLSTAGAVTLLSGLPNEQRPQASVSWWHLIADCARLDPVAEGWRVVPSLGRPADRAALISALAQGVVQAVAVHHLALDAEERLLPLDQRRAGVAGHGSVLPLLWQELVVGHGWSPSLLWQTLCWGPARFLGIEPPQLQVGRRDWILFDPQGQQPATSPVLAANRPSVESWLPTARRGGAVLAGGLLPPERWAL
ncbi:MAG: dihydroorotase [Cyanobacteriota bacterium]|nr:dihydroorotase [Cyanobacteriota bacterium]